MNYISHTNIKRKKKNKFFSYSAIIIIIVFMLYILTKSEIPGISNMSGNLVYGVSKFFKGTYGYIKNGTSYLDDVKSLKDENNKLKEQIKNLAYNEIDENLLIVENQDLKKMLEIKTTYNNIKLTYASVIMRNYSNWDEEFLINKGIKEGVKQKDTVVTKEGLVGYILKTSDHTSLVRTILSPASSVSVIISSVNELALVKGDFSLKNSQMLKLQYISMNTNLKTSDKIYTSGIGELYKKGIPIGKVEDIVNKKNETDRYAKIKTFVDFNNIDVVGIIAN